MGRRIYPDLVSHQSLTILSPDNTGLDAARLMAQRNIGAIMVAENGKLVGIVSERDLTRKLIASDHDPATTHVRDIMTRDPATVAPDDHASDALEIMREIGCRHLPVLDGDRIIGMLSIRDLYAAIHAELEDRVRYRDTHMLEAMTAS